MIERCRYTRPPPSRQGSHLRGCIHGGLGVRSLIRIRSSPTSGRLYVRPGEGTIGVVGTIRRVLAKRPLISSCSFSAGCLVKGKGAKRAGKRKNEQNTTS